MKKAKPEHAHRRNRLKNNKLGRVGHTFAIVRSKLPAQPDTSIRGSTPRIRIAAATPEGSFVHCKPARNGMEGASDEGVNSPHLDTKIGVDHIA